MTTREIDADNVARALRRARLAEPSADLRPRALGRARAAWNAPSAAAVRAQEWWFGLRWQAAALAASVLCVLALNGLTRPPPVTAPAAVRTAAEPGFSLADLAAWARTAQRQDGAAIAGYMTRLREAADKLPGDRRL